MKPLTVALLFIVTASIAFSQTQSSAAPVELAAADSVGQLHGKIRSLYPRLEGSSGELTLLSQAARYFRSLGLDVTEQELAGVEEGHSFSRVVEAEKGGARPDTLIIAAPANHLIETAPSEDGTVSVTALLVAARTLADSSLPVTVKFLLLGAERGPDERYPIGSRYVMNRYVPEQPTAAIYLSVDGASDGVRITSGSGGRVAPAWLLQRVVSSLKDAGLPFKLSQAETQIARADRQDRNSPIAAYLSNQVPAVGLRGAAGATSAAAGTSSEQETAAALAENIERLVMNSSEGLRAQWDSHYVYFQAGERILFIPERTYIVALLTVIFATSLYGVTFRRRFDRYAQTIGRNFWTLVGLYILAAGVLTFATLVIRYYLEARGFSSLWEFYPFEFFGAKVALTVFLFALLFQWMQRLPISKNGSFYSAAAIVLLFIGIVVLAAVNVSFSYYFVWAYICAFLFSVARSRVLKGIFLIAAPLWLVVAAIDVFTLPSLRAASSLLLSPVVGNLVLALVILPFLLMFIRLDFLIRHPRTGRRSFAVQIVTLVMAAAVAAFVVYIQSVQPYSEYSPQPVRITHELTRSGNRDRLIVASPAPLGAFSLHYGNETLNVSSDARRTELDVAGSELPWDVSITSRSFLSRREYVVTVDSRRRAYSVDARLRSNSELIVLESNFPFELEPKAGRADFSIGRFPPNPLELRFTGTSGLQAELVLHATLPGLGESAGIPDTGYRLLTEQSITQTFTIGER